jgi:type I restriction-modification system DNA methylase subunit
MNGTDKSLESWIWDAACSIRGAKDAAKYKEFILPLISSSRYINTDEGEAYRPLAEIVEELEAEAKTTDAALKAILARIGR